MVGKENQTLHAKQGGQSDVHPAKHLKRKDNPMPRETACDPTEKEQPSEPEPEPEPEPKRCGPELPTYDRIPGCHLDRIVALLSLALERPEPPQ